MFKFSMTEGEKWARIILFFLVGIYSVVVFVLTVKYVVKTYLCSRRGSHWSQTPEYVCRRQRGFFTDESYDDDPPKFEAALKCPCPSIKTVYYDIEQPPPSYEEYIKTFCEDKVNSSSLQTTKEVVGTNYFAVDEAKIHM